MKKITAPKKTTIKGQPHQLAYINDAEQGLLMALGGAGKPVHGVLAYYDEGDDYSGPGGDQTGDDMASMSDDKDDRDAGRARDDATKAQAVQNLADSIARHGGGTMRNPLTNSQMTAADFNFTTIPAAQRIAESYLNGMGVFAPSVFSNRRIGGTFSLSNIINALTGKGTKGLLGIPSYSNYFDDPDVLSAINDGVQGQLDDRMALAEAGYGLPGWAGKATGYLGAANINNIKEVLDAGGRPVFDENGELAGAFGKGLFGGEVYTGNPVKGMPETGYVDPLADGGADDKPQVVPPNPLTGVCEEGYVFDEQLQACRLDTRPDAGEDGGFGGTAPDMDKRYYRPTALDQAPQFGGDGFGAMNDSFINTFAYNPQNYEKQMNLNGFVPINGLLS